MSARDVVMVAPFLCVSAFCRMIVYILLFFQGAPVAGVYFSQKISPKWIGSRVPIALRYLQGEDLLLTYSGLLSVNHPAGMM